MHDDFKPQTDHEAAMARADLYKLANYSMKLFKMIHEGDNLEGWVQAKITKAADYIASVYHFMNYEMRSSEYGEKLENADVYSESVRRVFEQKLMEAKREAEKIKAAANVKEGKGGNYEPQYKSGISSPEEKKKQEKSMIDTFKKSGKKVTPGSQIHAIMKKHGEKVDEGFDDLEKYMKEKGKPQPSGGAGKKQGKAYGGSKQKDDDKEKDVKEGFEEMNKWLKDKRGPQPSGSSGVKKGSRYGGSKQVDDKEEDDDEGKKKNKKVKEAAKPDYLDFDKDGNKKEPMKKALKDKSVKEESKPSAGLSKEKKSSVVKKAKAGGDIGKPGKGFAKVEKAAKASGAKDPKAVAAAAMWKNVKR